MFSSVILASSFKINNKRAFNLGITNPKAKVELLAEPSLVSSR
jgi:hypothetical protein